MKRISFIFVLLFLSYLLISQKLFYWEKEILLTTKNTGKFEAVTNDKIMVVSYIVKEKGFSIYARYSYDGYFWSNPIFLKANIFSNTSMGDDFSITLDEENNLYLCYRIDPFTFVIVKRVFPYEENKEIKIIELKSSNYIFLPEIKLTSDNSINLIYNTNIENNFVLEYKKISKSGIVITESRIGEDYKSCMNPQFLEYKDLYFIAFQGKEKSVQDGLFYNIYLAVSNNKGKSWSYKRIVTSNGENNQGPFVFIKNDRIHLAWEKEDEKFRPHIFYKEMSLDLSIETKELIVSFSVSEAHSPYICFINNALHVFWFDDKTGIFQNYVAQIIGNNVINDTLIIKRNVQTVRLQPLIFKGNIKLFWLEEAKPITNLFFVQTDTTVSSPEIKIVNQNSLNIYNKNYVTVVWKGVYDISGIRGYKILLTKNKDEKTSERGILLNYFETTKTFTNLDDGEYFIKIVAIDNALNISKESIINFKIDTKAPEAPEFVNIKLDNDGYLETNSPLIEWQVKDKDIDTYFYHVKLFDYIDEEKIEEYKDKIKIGAFTATKENYLSLTNLENGILLIGVKAIDYAGNTSMINWQTFKLNKYVPVTFISSVKRTVTEKGEELIQIYGKGFFTDGKISRIIIDKDKKSNFDLVLEKDFTVVSDRLISIDKEISVEDGIYYIGVYHPVRGLVYYKNSIEFSGEWIFKDTDINFFHFYKVFLLPNKINFTLLVFVIASISWSILILILILNIFSILKEKVKVRLMLERLEEVRSYFTEKEYKKRREEMVKKGVGLTIKYTILIIILVVSIVIGTSFTLSYRALTNETAALAKEMKERANLVILNYETLIKDVYIFQQGLPRAIDITENISKLPDIGFVLFKEVDSEDVYIRYGEKEKIFFKKNYEAIRSDLNEKNKIIKNLVFNKEISRDIESFKNGFDGNTKIYPPFHPSKVSESYIYLRPVIIKEKEKSILYAYLVIGYSFEKIINEINSEKIKSIQIASIVTLVAIIISIIGAIFLASTTIRPIKKMSEHVNVIATIDDYEKLLGTENEKIEVKTKDEIGILAYSINEMTAKLIEKARSDKQMMLGKEIQKKFIPLQPHETEYIDIYGFYEGAKGVSGDYFDYKKLDDEHYAFIICDVAGKAVPAALIMVQISTIFHSYFANFNPKKNKIETVSIVNIINDTVAEREFTGRFAAILVIILNVKTGKALLTNAGYTQMLVYRDKKREAEWIKLNSDSGAAGVFPSYMLPHPYVQEEVFIDHGDIIYLFTDGIEESRSGRIIKNEKGEEKLEEFGQDRIKEILDKSHNKTPKEMIEKLIHAEKEFRGETEQYDDLTIIGIKRK